MMDNKIAYQYYFYGKSKVIISIKLLPDGSPEGPALLAVHVHVEAQGQTDTFYISNLAGCKTQKFDTVLCVFYVFCLLTFNL